MNMQVRKLVRFFAIAIAAGLVGGFLGHLWPFELGRILDGVIFISLGSLAVFAYFLFLKGNVMGSALKHAATGAAAGVAAMLVAGFIWGDPAILRSIGFTVAIVYTID